MNRPELEFPLYWEYKIIAQSTDEAFATVCSVIRDHGFAETPRASNLSRNGSYVTYTLGVHIVSREQLDNLSRDLAGCAGVKFLI